MIMCGSISAFQGRFADALLRELAGVTIPPERIFGLGTGLSTFQINNITTVIRIFLPLPNFFNNLEIFYQSQSRSAEAASEETRKPGLDSTVRYAKGPFYALQYFRKSVTL